MLPRPSLAGPSLLVPGGSAIFAGGSGTPRPSLAGVLGLGAGIGRASAGGGEPVTLFNFYVDGAGGNDANDGKTLATAWATIDKAVSTATAGSVVGVKPGSYAENTAASGTLTITRVIASALTIQGISGVASDVVITGASSATVNTIIQSAATNLVFKNVTFGMRVNTQSYAIRLAQCTNIQFVNCAFVVKSSAGTVLPALNIQPTGAGTTVSFGCWGCQFSAIGTDKVFGATANNAAGNTIIGRFDNCFVIQGTLTGDSLYFNGGNIIVTGGSYANGGSATHCLIFGIDSNTGGNPTTVTISGARIDFSVGSIGHGLLLGNGCVNCDVGNCYISGEDLGVVLKEHTGSVVHDCTIYTGSSSATYFKASSGGTFRNNTIIVDQAAASGCRLGAGDTGNKNQNVVFTDNIVRLTTTSKIFNWGDSTADLGGGVVNRNTYTLGGSGTIGTLRGAVVSPNTLAALQAAWSGYGVANDLASVVN